MKKLNKKGFTLVELLAVIVVLAVIMVIATQTITGVIEKNTAKALLSSVDIAAKTARTTYLVEGTVTLDDVVKNIDYSEGEYKISITDHSVCLEPQSTGKFKNVKADIINSLITDSTKYSVTPKTGDVNVTKLCKHYYE